MIRPNENPLTLDSLAADGIQGAGAKAQGPCDMKLTTQACCALNLAPLLTDAACDLLDRHALAIDDPEAGIVEAADLLDAARDALAGVQP